MRRAAALLCLIVHGCRGAPTGAAGGAPAGALFLGVQSDQAGHPPGSAPPREAAPRDPVRATSHWTSSVAWPLANLLVDRTQASAPVPEGYTRMSYACEGVAGAEAAEGLEGCAEWCARAAPCAGFLHSGARGRCRLLNGSCAAGAHAVGSGDWAYYKRACGAFRNASDCEGIPSCMWLQVRTLAECTDKGLPKDLLPDRTPAVQEASSLLQQLGIPLVAISIGVVLHKWTMGKLIIYFGGQSLMNLLAKSVLSEQIVSDSDPRLRGVPAPFLLTIIQQVVAMLIFGAMIAFGKTGRVSYVPRVPTSRREFLGICIFGASFGMNISFNNLGLSLLPISVNLVVRSCMPLFVFTTQLAYTRFWQRGAVSIDPWELSTMTLGVVCACVVVLASSSIGDEFTPSFFFGVFFCILSLVSGSLNFVLAGVLGHHGMNGIDSAGCMSVPAALFCVLPFFLMQHPINQWYTTEGLPDTEAYTDMQLLRVVLDKGPHVLGSLFWFGPLTFLYNIMQFWLVQALSATHTSFAGNFNKAATIVLAMVIGWERFPSGPLFEGGVFVGWDWLKAAGIVGNISAFAAYSQMKEKSKARGAATGAAGEGQRGQSTHSCHSQDHVAGIEVRSFRSNGANKESK